MNPFKIIFLAVLGIGLTANAAINLQPLKLAKDIQFHAPMPDLRINIAQLTKTDIIVWRDNRTICTITKEAQSYLSKRGLQIEITSLNASALIRAQKENK